MVALITVTHSIIDAGLARFPRPEEVLAGYAVAKSIATVLENPLFMVRQTTVALVKDRRSYHMVRTSVLGLTLFFCGLIAAVAYIPPLTQLFLREIMGLEGAAFAQARSALALMPFLPIATGWRNFQQGLAILREGNDLLPVATLFRLLYLVVFMFGVAPHLGIGGALAGSAGFVGGLVVEMLVMALGLRVLLRRQKADFLSEEAPPAKDESEEGGRLTWRGLAEFFVPLALTSLIMTGTLPLVNGFIARGHLPEVALAAYAVALSVGNTLVNPINMLHQVSLAFVDPSDPRSVARVRSFFARVALFFAALIALVAFTPFGTWLLLGPMGLPPRVAAPAQSCLGFFILIALASAVREYVWGVLLQARRTGGIGGAKAATTLVMAVILAGGLALYPGHMAIVAAASLAAGAIVEAALLVGYTRQAARPRQAPPGAKLTAPGAAR